MNRPAIAILLGRKGSKGVKNKNTMEILGRPVFHYPMMAALNSKYIDQIFVSTNDEEIIEGSRKFKVNIIRRPEYLCTDKALFEDALVHGYGEAKRIMNSVPKYVVALMCNAATVDAPLIDRAVELLEKDATADSAVTVSIFNMYSPLRARKKSKDGYLVSFIPLETIGSADILNCDRKSQGDAYFADMSHSVVRSGCLEDMESGMLPQRWMGKKILPVYNENGCDIDEEWQIDMTVRWLSKRGFTDLE